MSSGVELVYVSASGLVFEDASLFDRLVLLIAAKSGAEEVTVIIFDLVFPLFLLLRRVGVSPCLWEVPEDFEGVVFLLATASLLSFRFVPISKSVAATTTKGTCGCSRSVNISGSNLGPLGTDTVAERPRLLRGALNKLTRILKSTNLRIKSLTAQRWRNEPGHPPELIKTVATEPTPVTQRRPRSSQTQRGRKKTHTAENNDPKRYLPKTKNKIQCEYQHKDSTSHKATPKT